MTLTAPRWTHGIGWVKIYAAFAVAAVCGTILVLHGVEYLVEQELRSKQLRVQAMTQGLAQVQQLIHSEHRTNTAVRRLALNHRVGSATPQAGPTDHVILAQQALQTSQQRYEQVHAAFRLLSPQMQRLSQATAHHRNRILRLCGYPDLAQPAGLAQAAALPDTEASPPRLTHEIDSLDRLEEQLDEINLHATRSVNEINSQVQQAHRRAQRLRSGLSVMLVAVVVLGGSVFYLALRRIFKDLDRRRDETHRQNLELEATHRQEIQLRQSLDHERVMFKLILATVPQGVFWQDRGGIIRGCNHAFARLLGYPHPDAVIGNPAAQVLRPAPGEDTAPPAYDHQHQDRDILDTGRPRLDQEAEHLTHDGQTRSLLTSRVPLVENDGQTTGILGTCVDITERKELQRQLTHTHKLESIGSLAAGIAHEINTPTQFVSENIRFLCDAVDKLRRVTASQSQMLQDKHNPLNWEQRIVQMESMLEEIDYKFIDAEAPMALRESLDGLERIGEIVNAMRELSHPGGTSAALFDLHRAIRTSATICRNRWKYIAELHYDLDEQLHELPGHAGALGQVLVNLIVNATDALELHHPAEPGRALRGRIHISTRCHEQYAEIDVSDNGPGIPDELRRRIFDPYFTTKPVGQGTGQGLTIAHQVVVQQHQGELLVLDRPGGGTTFRLRLPLQQTIPQPLPHAA